METEVWFAIDHRTSECGYVAAASLLQNRPEGSHTNIRVAYVQGENAPADWWRRKLFSKSKRFSFQQIPIDLREFLGAKEIFDSMATYLRIAIPLYAGSDRIIYSDADVIFQQDISKLETNFGNELVGMVQDGFCSNRCEREKYVLGKHGKKSNDPYFNAGICVMNSKKYLDNDIYKKAVNLIKNDSAYLAVYDQTVLNCVFSNPKIIENHWNFCAFPKAEKNICDTATQSVVHFVGSPKPWDLLGEIYHPYSQIWVDAARKAGLKFPKIRKYFQFYSWQRALRIRKQYSVWKSKS